MEFLSYLGGEFEPAAFLSLLGGPIDGLLLGATAGLSLTMAVALLIPFRLSRLQQIVPSLLVGNNRSCT
ncbi:MAG: hypothetical protein KTR35_10485 [Gammaproteobacteria bacterium]|nr:hypothetical protein [Gammaproteobacteria bacterium]